MEEVAILTAFLALKSTYLNRKLEDSTCEIPVVGKRLYTYL